jgi:2'-5' RNA ligase
MTSYQDYLIILSPPENISQHVRHLKEKCAGVIGEFESRHSRAHVSVQSWSRKKPVWVEPLIPKLERDLQTLPPLTLEINGFGVFDQQEFQTIYAKFNSTPATKVWFKLLRKFFSTPPFEPHITIARSIELDDFKMLWPHFKNQPFNARFTVDKLTVLRRETIGYDKTFKVCKEIPFNQKLDFETFTQARLKTHLLPVSRKDMQQISLF